MRTKIYKAITSVLLVIVLANQVGANGVNFTACMIEIQGWAWNASQTNPNVINGLLYANGSQIPSRDDIHNMTAVTYEVCLAKCGSSQEPFSWSTFSQEFSAWLLPYLALISQLPFGARHRPENLMSALLTVGSPVLAGYSMFLTLLNARWVSQSFESISYPNSNSAVKVLSSLQQVPLRVTSEDCLLPSLVILPENDSFWSDFADFLDYTHTWSISAAMSILWVVVAYIFTVADSLSDVSANINSNGQGVGSIWLWLLPIVIGWLQLSPKCDYGRLQGAFHRANGMAYVASHQGPPVKASVVSDICAISIDGIDVSSPDEKYTPPVFNYARALSWAQAAEETLNIFRRASINAKLHKPVNPTEDWRIAGRGDLIHPDNRSGSPDDVKEYCRQPYYAVRSRWASGIFLRMFLSSLLPLALQWGTTGAAILAIWFTPTTKLGCRSLSYLIYGALSTIVWMLLVASSILGHYSIAYRPREARYHVPVAAQTARTLSTVLRWIGKTLAIINAIGLVASSVFQFSNLYDRCYCNGSVIGRGASAYILLDPSAFPYFGQMRGSWLGALALASGCAVGFIGFINLFSDSVST